MLRYGRAAGGSAGRTVPPISLGSYERLFADLHAEFIPYYRSWCHDSPMLVSPERDDELRELQRVLYKCCEYYVRHYREYLDRVPYSERVLRILDELKGREFRAGTFRPDYLICEDGSLRLCEITSRFFGNGYFLSFFTEHAGRVFAREAGVAPARSYFESLLAYFAGMARGFDRLVVLKSADKSDSIRLYVPFYRALGLETTVCEAGEVETHAGELRGKMVVSALNQKDLLSLSDGMLLRMADAGMRNDLRTVFLLHDKRFFYLFGQNDFTSRCLTDAETRFLRGHAAETWVFGRDGEIWDHARAHKDGYILKHHCLGKSEQVYAGCLTAQPVWDALFSSGAVRNMILQPFLRQRVFRTEWEGRILDDYVCGTILTVDDRYFGTGLFRTSTRPVINQTDARKVAQLITDRPDAFIRPHIL